MDTHREQFTLEQQSDAQRVLVRLAEYTRRIARHSPSEVMDIILITEGLLEHLEELEYAVGMSERVLESVTMNGEPVSVWSV